MAEVATQAESSTAEATDVFNGQYVSMEEYSRYRSDGTVPERFNAEQAEPAPAATLEETEKPEGEDPKPEPESDPDETQELKPKTARRIQQLLDKTKELERKLAEKTDVKPESSTVQKPTPQYAFPKPSPEDKNADGTLKYETYEDVVEAIGRWAAKEERAQWERETTERETQNALKSKLDESRSRYEDADDVIFPTNQAIQEAQMPLAVKDVIGQSDVFTDLLYVIGSDPATLKDFIALAQSNPRAALSKVFEYERGIVEALAKPADDTTPAKKQTAAPKPPTPVGGGSSRAFDISDETLSPDDWARKRNQEIAKKRS